ncbi:MAG: hypothetical protein H7Y59_16895 [Anaerolineales bacterium]|nr:hypothetical protein [Anaerolineales bacterium]
MNAMLTGTMGTAVENTVCFHAVANDTASTMSTLWCNGMNGTFKTIEYMGFTIQSHFKIFIVLIAANFACGLLFIGRKIS